MAPCECREGQRGRGANGGPAVRHKARQRKPPVIRARRPERVGLREGQAICDWCGVVFDLAPRPGHPTYVVPALWDGVSDVTASTARFDKPECYTAWVAAHRPRPIRSQPDRRPPEPKNTAPMDPML